MTGLYFAPISIIKNLHASGGMGISQKKQYFCIIIFKIDF
jgi:hypothetical protein